ncbi:MAG: hypothetical protein KDC48_19170, partial [Planctomycetes bacterium]|nr:hypothetical protein [Planctomycetota bacterium]
RSDQYALGLILFELLSFRRALRGSGPDDLHERACAGRLEPLTPVDPRMEIPKPLAAVVAKATRPEPEDRYPTVKDLADDVRRFLHNEPVTAMPDTWMQKLGRWVVRHRVATINIAAWTMVCLLALGGFHLYRTQAATLAAEQREVHVGHMLTTVADHANAIDARLLRVEGILEGLAANTAAVWSHGRADEDRLYFEADFRDPARSPPDLVASPVYGTSISVDWPVYELAPGVDRATLLPVLRRIESLRHGMRHLTLRAAGDGSPETDREAARRMISHADLPVSFMQVGFEQGFLIAYPGRAGFPDDYDPRTRPWYADTVRSGRTRWLPPFDDLSGRGRMLAAATPVQVDGGEVVGVATVEMTLARVRADFLDTHALPGIERLLLLDDQGTVLAVSGAAEEHGARSRADTALPALPDAYRDTVMTDIAARRSGFIEFGDGPRDLLLSYHRLGANGWYLLAEADAAVVTALY